MDKCLKFYDLDKYFEVFEFFAKYHDAGKMHINWNLDSREGHSHHSLEYMLEKKIEYREKTLDPVLKFLILRHHSSLSETISDKIIELNGKSRSLRNVFNVLFKKEMDYLLDYMLSNNMFNVIVDIVDVFGLFKITDVSSAKNKPPKLEKPRITEDIVKRIIGKNINEDRWNEQKRLSELPEISMLRAYTGWGKTDVSLLFLRDKNVSKVFYLLPTITAINGFFEKLSNATNEEVSKYFYFLDAELKEEHEKFGNLYFIENFTATYNITTIDQFLISFLQIGKYYTRRVMFRNSGLIIDEIHLLNPLMLDLLAYFINKYKSIYNFKVLFMSATFPDALI
ncbi:MAG: DEAD/DEAH box helicase, partial [Candidatus Aenigmarchaeota archaeon]|nr:DEAD/DEAH box helicase [Candidatus Aenigmarchaeota archaeon]